MSAPAPSLLEAALQGRSFEAVVIGASAGGIAALMEILPGLPARGPLPIVVVVHMMRGRPSQLAEVFSQRMEMAVQEAADKQALAGGTVYFAPSGYHLSLEADRCFSLSCEPPHEFSRPAIDFIMSSAADVYGAALAGILLTGANHDGAAGLAAIGEAGGLTVVQDPAEAQVDVMPLAAIRRRAPDLILPLREIRQLLALLENADA
ncbi:chemotaxis protein CheB [Pseudoduganella sp. LjRoot289]|uniref:chemotaxis protein CheB n=1 Tax=Pseudoduganella sp. LjRoot289 TaxID=3342314 RepID=UPI003ECD1C3E